MTREKLRELEYRYGLQRVQVAGAIETAELWAFRHDRLVTLCTVGAEQELCCTVFERDLAAGAAIIRTASLRSWVPGRVWLNDQPYLAGTNIQGIVVGDGDWAEVYPLTEPEAELVAVETISAITITLGRNTTALCDLFRNNAFPHVSDEFLSEEMVITSKLARDKPLRSLQYRKFGKFLALTDEEPAGYVDNPDNFEFFSALELLPRIHGSRLLLAAPRPGEQLRYGHNGWEYSVT